MARPTRMTGDDLRAVARYQKCALLCVLVYVLLFVPQCVLPAVAPPDTPVYRYVALSALVPLAVVALVAAVFVFLLSVKVFGPGVSVLLALMTLAPCGVAIVLLVINGTATAVLRRHGVRVGLLGAKAADLERLDVNGDWTRPRVKTRFE